MSDVCNMNFPQLIEKGWTIIPDSGTGHPTAIRSEISEWNELTWAQQTYYRGKYRFDDTGVLEIALSELSQANEDSRKEFRRDSRPDKHVAPGGALAGSNERLRRILEGTRADLSYSKYDDSALVHIGPDDSAIYTSDSGWGPLAYWPEDRFCLELDDFYMCVWELPPYSYGISEAPYWACPGCNGL